VAITRVEKVAPASNAPDPFSTRRREITGFFMSVSTRLALARCGTPQAFRYSCSVLRVFRRQQVTVGAGSTWRSRTARAGPAAAVCHRPIEFRPKLSSLSGRTLMKARRDRALWSLRLILIACATLPASLFAYASWVNYKSTFDRADEDIARSL